MAAKDVRFGDDVRQKNGKRRKRISQCSTRNTRP
jgi:hypothetical protein